MCPKYGRYGAYAGLNLLFLQPSIDFRRPGFGISCPPMIWTHACPAAGPLYTVRRQGAATSSKTRRREHGKVAAHLWFGQCKFPSAKHTQVYVRRKKKNSHNSPAIPLDENYHSLSWSKNFHKNTVRNTLYTCRVSDQSSIQSDLPATWNVHVANNHRGHWNA